MRRSPSFTGLAHPNSSRGGKIRVRTILYLLVLIGLGAGGWAAYTGKLQLTPKPKIQYLTEPVKKGPLEISITERGSIDSAANVTLMSKVEGSTTIIRIIPEGTSVKIGDELVELDSAALRDKETQARIDVEKAEAALKQAHEKRDIQVTQNESDINAAKLKLRLAELDLEQYQQGDYPKELQNLEGQLKLAEEDFKRAQESYEFSKRNSKKGYVSQSNLEAARIAVNQKQLAYDVALKAVEVLKKYTLKRQTEEKVANATEFGKELDRVRRKAEAALIQAEADLKAATLTAEVERSKLQKLRDQIAACKMVAPQDGEVVYANQSSTDRRGGSDQVLIAEGAQVRERQAIINIPDYSKMQVNARIHESRIGFVREGMRVTVTTDATPGVVYNGSLFSISTVPLSGAWPNRDLKEYAAVIRITDAIETVRKLKPGLTAEIQVQVDYIPSCLYVPVQAVITIGKKHFAFPIVNDVPSVREVTVGKTNDIDIEVITGLEEGLNVLMNPRAVMLKEITVLEDDARKEEEKQNQEEAKSGKKKAPLTTPKDPSGQAPPGGPYRGPGGPGSPATAGGPPGGPRPDGPGAPGGPGGFDPSAFFVRMDKDGDGKLTGDEISDRLRENLASVDTNSDGSIDLGEFKANAARRPTAGGPPSGPGGGGPRGGGAP